MIVALLKFGEVSLLGGKNYHTLLMQGSPIYILFDVEDVFKLSLKRRKDYDIEIRVFSGFLFVLLVFLLCSDIQKNIKMLLRQYFLFY